MQSGSMQKRLDCGAILVVCWTQIEVSRLK
jgi:hypothetical protein